ncbi:MAG: hypothetical protein K2Q11_08060 [Burkholderiaceae bacterium]|nr:hypothetical protein [Burkholderiaceae bacterium]
MEVIQSTSGASSSQIQLQSARREAQYADQTARDLGVRAQDAQRSADQEQGRADGLDSQASNAVQRAGAAHQNVNALANPQRSVAVAVDTQTPVVNISGQIMGLLLNTQA